MVKKVNPNERDLDIDSTVLSLPPKKQSNDLTMLQETTRRKGSEKKKARPVTQYKLE